MKRVLLVAVALLVIVASPVLTQTGALAQIEVRVYAPGVVPGTGAVLATSLAPFSAAVCNQTSTSPPAGTIVPEPKSIEFVDPDPTHLGKVCWLDRTAFFAGLATASGQFKADVTLINDTGRRSVSEVALDSFLHLGPVPGPGRVRLRGGGA